MEKKRRKTASPSSIKSELQRPESSLGCNPNLGLQTIRDTMSELVAEIFARRGISPDVPWRPPVDMFEDQDFLVVESHLPGVEKEAIRIHATHDLLIISGSFSQGREIPEENFFLRENCRGEFRRSIPLPYEVEPHTITAELANGVLRVALPIRDRGKKIPHRVRVE
jgi:HSP20 family protein